MHQEKRIRFSWQWQMPKFFIFDLMYQVEVPSITGTGYCLIAW